MGQSTLAGPLGSAASSAYEPLRSLFSRGLAKPELRVRQTKRVHAPDVESS